VGQLLAYRKLGAAEAVVYAVRETHRLLAANMAGLGQLATRGGVDSLEGPVGIVRRTASVFTAGSEALLRWLALISVALALFNLLPVPGLDGGRLLFLAIEAVRGKPVDQRVEGIVTSVGFLLLIGLIAWVTLKDVFRPKELRPLSAPARLAPAADAGAGP
jgi:regulator of sigma E protease